MMVRVFFVVLLLQLLAACGSGSGGDLGSAPQAPELSLLARNGAVEISWTQVNNARLYKLYWSMTADFTPGDGGVFDVSTTEFMHDNLQNFSMYYYKVKAVNDAGESAYSSVASAIPVTPPDKPAPVMLTARDGALLVDWSEQQNTLWYDLLVADNPGMVAADTISNITKPYELTDLNNGREYYVAVKAVNNSGESARSDASPGIPSRMRAIAAGYNHNCVIKTDGSAWCWGRNDFGQVGRGITPRYPKTAPVPVYTTEPTQWVSLAAGDLFNCALDSTDDIWCWGANGRYQLGNGTTTTFQRPEPVASDNKWRSLAVGAIHACAISKDNSLWCWGWNEFGQSGNGADGLGSNVIAPQQVGGDNDWQQLALGQYSTCALKQQGSIHCWGYLEGAASTEPVLEPMPVNNDMDWRSLGTGMQHVCAIKENASLWCWGSNVSGQLGIDSTESFFATPQQVLNHGNWLRVIGGRDHTCALKSDFTLWCWGGNGYGQLGDGTQVDRSTPLQIGSKSDWMDVAAEGMHTCAVNKAGEVFCWGANLYGELGIGSESRLGTQDVYVPALTDNRTDWLELANGWGHSCALRAGNGAYCWGYNEAGQLGNDSYAIGAIPTEVAGGHTWKAIQSGSSSDTVCGLKQDNSLWCWGRGSEGQMGDGSSGVDVFPKVPVPVNQDTDWDSVTPGYTHVCAIKLDGTLWCWGDSSWGKLGLGSGANIALIESQPRQVGLDNDWLSVATGEYHTCAVKSSGTLWCWGLNDVGQVGNDLGTGAVLIDAPVPVGSDTDWVLVHSGKAHNCALKQDGSAWCWGRNDWGQAANVDSGGDPSGLVRVGLDHTWLRLSLGFLTSCGIKPDQSLWCWGANYTGQLGIGTKDTFAHFTPSQVLPDSSWQRVAVSDSHICGIRSEGTLWCWGYNTYGNLGDGMAMRATHQKVMFE